MNLASELSRLEPGIRSSVWADHEHVRGYGVMMVPFSSGHLLGLRVFPQTDFGPYASVWHRDPAGAWSIYNDGASLDTTCPRLWGPALRHAELASIEITWIGPTELRVGMTEPSLEWTRSIHAPLMLRLLNAINAGLPLRSWRVRPLVRLREWVAGLLGMGDLRFNFTTPVERETVFAARRMLLISSSEASWGGHDLGDVVRLEETPTIGGVPLPTRASFVVGEAHTRIHDFEEYHRTAASAGESASAPRPPGR